MSTELVAVTVAGGMAIALALVVKFLIMRKRRFQPLEVAWKQFANERGMRFIFVAGWTRVRMISGFPPAMTGEIQGVPVEITLDYTQNAEMTRVDAILPGVTNDFLFAIYRRSAPSQIPQGSSSMADTPTGNKVFDAKFALYSNNSDLARSILDRRLAQVIGDFRREFTYLHVNRTRFALMWAGRETDPEALDEAIRVVWTACRRRA